MIKHVSATQGPDLREVAAFWEMAVTLGPDLQAAALRGEGPDRAEQDGGGGWGVAVGRREVGSL